jgi:hypothetical protein
MPRKVLTPLDMTSIPTGTAPLTLTSTTAITNLNADLLDGKHATDIENTNYVINGAFDIWQRGTTSLATATNALTGFTADRWQLWRGSYAAGVTCSRQTVSSVIPGIQYSARVQRTSGNTGLTTINFSNGFETVNSIALAGDVVTLSAWIKVGADFSGGTILMRAVSGTGTDQRISSTYTGANTFLSSTITPTASFVRYTATATIPSTATQVGIYFQYTPTGTAGIDDWFEVAGVQLEVGNIASTFRRNAQNYGEELASCQRYFQRIDGTTAFYGFGAGSGTTVTSIFVPISVPFRVAPTSVSTSGSDIVDGAGNSLQVTALALGTCTPNTVVLNATHVLNDTANRPYFIRLGTSSYVELNAEI